MWYKMMEGKAGVKKQELAEIISSFGPWTDNMTKAQTGIFQFWLPVESHTNRGIANLEMPSKREHPCIHTVHFFCSTLIS